MDIVPLAIPDLKLVRPKRHGDARGWFMETYRRDRIAEAGIADDFVQDNQSFSVRNVLRGMHYQLGLAKHVRCARGAIYDVVVDARPGSPTHGEWEGFELSDEDMRMVYVPIGFGHGFAVLSDVADVLYKQSAEWSAASDRGFNPEDPQVGIDWPIPPGERVLSARDREAPALADLEAQLT
jgi:dTDP-4-dehydrorhamnose 3,5-epimerase